MRSVAAELFVMHNGGLQLCYGFWPHDRDVPEVQRLCLDCCHAGPAGGAAAEL